VEQYLNNNLTFEIKTLHKIPVKDVN
jgi:hypothetical protein